MSGFRGPPRKGENYELSADLNSEYREKRKDAIKKVIANMTVQKGTCVHPLLAHPVLSSRSQTLAVCSRMSSRTCRPMTSSRRSSYIYIS